MTVLKEARISRQALQHNLDFFMEKAGNRKVLACVKAYGYGHGFYEIMPVLSQADGCYVHTWDAAMRLRRDWPNLKVVLAGFPGSTTLLEHLAEEQIDWVVYDHSQLALIQTMPKQNKSVIIWLKVDTGMHRLGFLPEEIPRVMAQLDQSPWVRDVVLMTHFSCSDDKHSPRNHQQAQIFQKVYENYPNHYTSLGNTAVALHEDLNSGDWLRVGIGLYGISPYSHQTGAHFGLKPVMTFCAQVISVRRCAKGQAVGYGGQWQSPRDTHLAVLAVGYGDGYPRCMPSGTPVWIAGQRYPLVGRVSMDSIVVDLGPDHTIEVGDWAELWGAHLPVEDVAHCAQTIPYELVARVGRRVRRCVVA